MKNVFIVERFEIFLLKVLSIDYIVQKGEENVKAEGAKWRYR